MTRRQYFRRMCRGAGSEVANDLGELLVSAFEEVGLRVLEANYLKPEKANDWCVFARGVHPNWDGGRWSSLIVDAWVPSTGAWPDALRVSCAVSDRIGAFPVRMEGRSSASVADLVGEIKDTVREREIVVQRIAAGELGPFLFERTSWRHRNYLQGLPC